MAANQYSQVVSGLVTALEGLTGYPGLIVRAKLFKPNDLPEFEQYLIVVSPNAMPWDERRIGIPLIQYIMRADLFLLVKNFDEFKSLFETTVAGELGLFQMIDDVKTLLRLSDLGGLIDKGNKTYDEPSGPLNFEASAVVGFDSDEKAFVHRARLVYTARLNPFCHPRLP
jgi:hypothetical protein